MSAMQSSSVPPIASAAFAEQQDEGVVRRRVQVGAAAAASEADRKGLEDGAAPGGKLVSIGEVNQHKSQGDAWVVVDGVVYDISHFVDAHPGGVEVSYNPRPLSLHPMQMHKISAGVHQFLCR